MGTQQPTRNFVEGLSYYVPAMQCGGNMGQDLRQRVNFGTPAVEDVDAIATGVDADGAVAETAVDKEATGNYGRNASVTASGATGGDLAITLKGRDYLGQPMTEIITVANGDGTGTVDGLKAFKHIDSYEGDGGAANAVTVTIGWGPALGLPYKTVAVERELEDGVLASAGTLTAPVVTDPATAITGDPRGLYTPTGTLDATAEFEADCVFDNSVNSSGNGGLHGIAHYYA